MTFPASIPSCERVLSSAFKSTALLILDKSKMTNLRGANVQNDADKLQQQILHALWILCHVYFWHIETHDEKFKVFRIHGEVKYPLM